MVYRDPDTGKFVSGSEDYDDFEVVTLERTLRVDADQMNGTTGQNGDVFEVDGVELLDYDEIVDRNERLDLLHADHRAIVFTNSTQTEDGTFRAGLEVSASPAIQGVTRMGHNIETDSPEVDTSGLNLQDTVDIIGRPLNIAGTSAFSDSASGMSGGGAPGADEVEIGGLPAPVAEFHPRDELFLNGVLQAWNVDDAGLWVNVQIQHIYGVASE